jgi:flagellar basal-body rod protein FlgB
MAISFDKALGNFPAHLSLYGERSSLLAANIANADTPRFKARDIDFSSLLAKAGGENMVMKTTHAKHLNGASAASSGDLLYRIPTQPSVDGNTVDTQVEQAEFAENAVRYQSTLTFLNSKFKGLRLAIKGD